MDFRNASSVCNSATRTWKSRCLSVRCTASSVPVAIREMAPGDLDQVLSVERQAFAGPERHGLRAFTRCMRHRQGLALMAEGDFGVGLGEPAEHIIVGWMLGYVRCRGFHVEYLAVLPDMQRKGIGRGLLQPAFELARQAPVAKPRVTLHVRERNLAAQKFYQALGFRAARVLRGFYDDGQGEDAYLMVWKNLGGAKRGK